MMTGGSLGSLTIDLAANITRFERSLTRAERLADKRAKGIQRTFSRMAGVLAASLASFGFVRAVEQSLEFADSIGKTADKLGIATDALQEYRFAAEQTGVSQQALDVGLQRFARRLAEAQTGTGVLSDVFKRLNIDIGNSVDGFRSTEDVLNDYADAIKNAGNSNEQLLLAFKAFDTEGVAFVNTLKSGSAGLQAFRDEAQALGIVMSDDLIRNAEKANDQLNIVSKVLKIELTTAIVALAPHITELATAFADLSKGDVQKLPGWVKTVASSFSVLGFAAGEATNLIGTLGATVALIASGEFSALKELFAQSKENTEAAEKALDTYIEKIYKLNAATTAGAEGGLAGDVTGADTDKRNFLTGMTQEEMQTDFDNAVMMGDQFRAMFEQQNLDRARSEETVNSLIISSRMNAMSQAVGFLQVLGQKSKAAAMAALVLQKGLAIAQTIVSTQAASMRAMAELGPIAGPAAVANIQAMGAAAVGLIGATGLLQASYMGGSTVGGAVSSGTVANPLVTTDADAFTSVDSGTTGTITINVNGVVTEEILQDLIIPAIQDATNDKDVILFRSDSRQALEMS